MSAVLPSQAPFATNNVAASAVFRRAEGRFSFGKYREIILAVALFLLLDLGVLVLNFYTSFQIAKDAVSVNLSGRQRMLTQRTAKALLTVEAAQIKGLPVDAQTDELRNAVQLFDTTLKAFQTGASVPGGDGKPVFLEAAQGAKAATILATAQDIWTPYLQVLNPVLAGNATPQQVLAAADYARSNNLKLLAVMNELTSALEAVASQRATDLRLVQTVAIVLALLNFAFILFKFLRRLRTSDEAVEAVNEENREILDSVREGLFLMTPDFKLGTQLSESAHSLFGKPLVPGQAFFEVLAPLVSPKALQDARDYVDLLFSPHVKESLVQGINPLSHVQIASRNRLGEDAPRYLSFNFNRVKQDRNVRHLLVTVQDISERVGLEHKLGSERQRSQNEFGMLLKAFAADPALLRQFVQRAEEGLLEVNDLLRGTASVHSEALIVAALDNAARRIHAIKGDAATLGLDSLAAQAHQFETNLQRVRESGGSLGSLGEALLALPMPLEDLLNKVSALKSLTGLKRGQTDKASGISINEALTELALQVARDSGKRVQAAVRMGSQTDLPPHTRDLVHEVAVQLLRNAVVHGIEAPAIRASSGKNEQGQVQLSLTRGESEWVLSVRDDGAGISAARVRQRLLDLAWYTREQLEGYSDKQIVAHIFKPGFSTAGELSAHAGRGVGLDLVQANVQKLAGRLTLHSSPGQNTEFKLMFAA